MRQMLDVVKNEWVRLLESSLHVAVQDVDVGLVHRHGASRQRRRLVDGDASQLGVLHPIILEDEEELLCAPEGDDGEEHLTPAVEDLVHAVGEASLALLARGVGGDAVGALANDDVRGDGREVRAGEVAVRSAAVVAGVEHAESADVNLEHARAEDMARAEGGHLDAVDVHLAGGVGGGGGGVR